MGNNISEKKVVECYVPNITHNSLRVSFVYISHSTVIHVKQLDIRGSVHHDTIFTK